MIVADLAIAGALVVIAWRMLFRDPLIDAMAVFVFFGVLTALAWVRLGAPDVALAEAAVGAGITGALLLDAARRIGGPASLPPLPPLRRSPAAALAAGLSVAWVGILVVALADLPREHPGLTPAAQAAMEESGVTHEVTAVLLSFRAYDTWLEVVVVLLAVVGLLALRRSTTIRLPPGAPPPGSVLPLYARALLPVALLIGAYVLLAGTGATGGAFQAGALAAAALILFVLAGFAVPAQGGGWVRLAAGAAAIAFAVAALITLVGGAPMLEYRDGAAGAAILIIEFTVAVSVAVTLAGLFLGAAPPEDVRGGR